MANDPSPFDDPFGAGSSERTFVKPSPGGWQGARSGTQTQVFSEAQANPAAATHGINPLLEAANPLLMLVPRLRHAKQMSSPDNLRAQLVQGLRDFSTAAQSRGVAPERVMAARYVLCTMLDEAAADTPWGGGGTWARHSLLVEFHNESSGGEKVFQLMARLAEKPQDNRDLLELIYAAISLGFEGRYRVVEGGRAQLDAVRARLAQLLAQQRGPYPAALAQHWQGAPATSRKQLGWLPLAVMGALCLLLLGGLYAAFSWSLSGRSDPVYTQIQGLRLTPPVTPTAQPAPQPRLAQFLQSDIKAGLLAVRDEVDRSVVVMRGDGLFAPASSSLEADREALMQRVAQAMVRVPGPVLITGHTDNVAIRTLRFPSNWHLSDERAREVMKLMAQAGLPAERMRAEGRADAEPAAPNDSVTNRALNRRVEIMLLTGRPEATRPVSGAGAAAAPQPAASR